MHTDVKEGNNPRKGERDSEQSRYTHIYVYIFLFFILFFSSTSVYFYVFIQPSIRLVVTYHKLIVARIAVAFDVIFLQKNDPSRMRRRRKKHMGQECEARRLAKHTFSYKIFVFN